MKLGILVVDSTYPQHVVGFSQAALGKGWTVKLFFNDLGVNLIKDPAIKALAQQGVSMSFCETSARRLGFALESLPRCFKRGTQLQHAILHQFSDQVLVL